MTAWQESLFEVLKTSGVKLVTYVPDAGHAQLISRAHPDQTMRAVVLTTEEEGVAFACGAALGGERAVLLMQSSGVGNCINMFSLLSAGRFPFLTLITMRGEWAEFNPWQVPMSKATTSVLESMGITVYRVTEPDDVAGTVEAAARFAFDGDQAVAVLLAQRLIGRKQWTSEE
jgi:sulfopyruvate decarboxylase alpha subunit